MLFNANGHSVSVNGGSVSVNGGFSLNSEPERAFSLSERPFRSSKECEGPFRLSERPFGLYRPLKHIRSQVLSTGYSLDNPAHDQTVSNMSNGPATSVYHGLCKLQVRKIIASRTLSFDS